MAAEQDPNDGTIVGIDLGTTFSCIARIDEHGRPETLLNSDGIPLTPSAVLFESDDNIVVGQLARDSAVASPENVIILVKRQMGRQTRLTAGGKEHAPEAISAMILKKLKQDAEQRLGCEINHAVITVPAFFGAGQVKATQDAGEMAGFTVHRVFSEPVAAALAYGFTAPQGEQTLLVYDLGGGTFDITLFKIRPPADGNVPEIEMISTGGNHDLGGANWDERIMDYVADEFTSEHGPDNDPRDDLAAKQDLYIKCEKAKISLCKLATARIVCQHAGQAKTVELNEAKLRELTEDLLMITETETDGLLNDKGVSADQIDQVLLAGGSTRLKMVREMLEAKFPGKVNAQIDADQCVAHGAAWMAHLIAQGEAPDEGDDEGPGDGPIVRMVAPHALGVAAKDGKGELMIYPLVVKDAQLVAQEEETFYTSSEGQRSVVVPVYENEAREKTDVRDPDAGRQIGEVVVSDLPAGLPANEPVTVTFEFDTSFRLTVVAKVAGKESTGQLDVGSGMDGLTKRDIKGRLAGVEIQG